jgi:hypothetical protein
MRAVRVGIMWVSGEVQHAPGQRFVRASMSRTTVAAWIANRAIPNTCSHMVRTEPGNIKRAARSEPFDERAACLRDPVHAEAGDARGGGPTINDI